MIAIIIHHHLCHHAIITRAYTRSIHPTIHASIQAIDTTIYGNRQQHILESADHPRRVGIASRKYVKTWSDMWTGSA